MKTLNPSISAAAISPSGVGLGSLLLVALLSLAVYANSLPNGFTLDDLGIISHNPNVTQTQWTRIWVDNYWPSSEGPSDILYRPLTLATYLLQWATTGEQTWPFHAVNVLLHTLVSLMVTVLAWRLFRQRSIALLAGLLFAVHPLHTEVVANVVGRAELLAAFWSLAALLIFLPPTPLLSAPPAPHSFWHGPLVALCLLLAMLSKETPIVMIGAFLGIDLWRWSHWPAPKPRLKNFLTRQVLRYHLWLWLVVAFYLTLRISTVGLAVPNHIIHPVVNPLIHATLLERLITPFLLLTKYLLLIVWPQVLSADYSAPSIMPTANLFHPLVLLGLLFLAAALYAVITYWKRFPQLAFLALGFVFSYLLVANYIRIGTIFGERLFYWPSVFVLIALAFLAVRLWQVLTTGPTRPWFRYLTATAGAAALVALSARTVVRNPDWQNNVQMALATAIANPSSAKACIWAGQTLLMETTAPQTHALGEQLLQRAIVLYPTMGQSYWELSKYYVRQKKYDQVLIYLSQAALYDGGRYKIRFALRCTHADLARWPIDDIYPVMEKHVRDHPADPTAHLAFSLILQARQRHTEARGHLLQALGLAPNFHEAAAELGALELRLGNTPLAVKLLRNYVITIPLNLEARCQLADALMQLDPHQFPDALREADMNLTRAATIQADHPPLRALRFQWLKKCEALQRELTPAARADTTAAPTPLGNRLVKNPS